MGFFDEVGYDGDNTEAGGGSFEPLPKGRYRVIFEDVARKSDRNGNPYLNLKLCVVSPTQFNGRYLFENLNVANPNEKARNIAHQTLKSIELACGIILKGKEPEYLIGRQCWVEVYKHEKSDYNGEERIRERFKFVVVGENEPAKTGSASVAGSYDDEPPF